jgi:hypothetical protein
MKKSFLLIGAMMAMLLSGCAKLYTDVKSDKYATFQMVTKGESFSWNDNYKVNIYDYTDGCKGMTDLGLVYTSGAGPTDVVKLPVEKPLLFKVVYLENRGANQYIDYTNFVLTPEQNRHYVVEYERKEVDGEMVTSFYVFMQKGNKAFDIPSNRIRDFNNRECF